MAQLPLPRIPHIMFSPTAIPVSPTSTAQLSSEPWVSSARKGPVLGGRSRSVMVRSWGWGLRWHTVMSRGSASGPLSFTSSRVRSSVPVPVAGGEPGWGQCWREGPKPRTLVGTWVTEQAWGQGEPQNQDFLRNRDPLGKGGRKQGVMLEGEVPNPGSSQGWGAPGRGGARQPPHCSMLELGCVSW